MDPDGQPGAQTQLRALGDAHHLVTGSQRVEYAPLADPLQMLGWAGPAQDGEAAQLVGFVVGGRIGEDVRLGVFDSTLPDLLDIESGDVLVYPNTWSHFLNRLQPGVSIDELAQLLVVPPAKRVKAVA